MQWYSNTEIKYNIYVFKLKYIHITPNFKLQLYKNQY